MTVKKIISLTKKFLSKIKTEILLFIAYILLCFLIYLKANIAVENLSDIKQILITSTSIFSAIVIGFLLNGTSNHLNKIEKYKEKLIEASFQLTSFRRFIHYLVLSNNIWGQEFYSKFLSKLRDLYPYVNINVSKYKMNEKNPVYSVVSDERYEYLTTSLFLSCLTIADIKKHEHMELVTPSVKFKYSLEKLYYMHESFNNIWYYLKHKRADVNFSTETFNHIFHEDFTKQMKTLFGETASLSDFNEKILVDKANEFYGEIIPEMIDNIVIIKKGVPKLIKFLLLELILILIFGLIIPITTYLVKEFTFTNFLKGSVVIVLSSFGLITYHLIKFIFFDSKKY